MSTEDFFQILVTELQQQDPLEPTDTGDMISQVAQIRTIEQSTSLNDTLAKLADQQNVAGASDLLGKHVIAASTDGNGNEMLYEGIVTGIHFNEDGLALLELNTGDTVRMADLRSVSGTEQPVFDLNAWLAGLTPEGAAPSDANEDEGDKQGTAKRSWLGNLLNL